MLKILFILFLLPIIDQHKLQLKRDLKHDRVMLNEHGSYMAISDKRKLRCFDKYANMNLSNFKFSMVKLGKHNIKRWIGAGGLKIFQVKSSLHVDTILEEPIYDTLKHATGVIKTPVKAHLNFRTYIINKPDNKRLIYSTQQRGGLYYFSIGNKTYYPIYEAIMYGAIYPDEKEILILVTSMK